MEHKVKTLRETKIIFDELKIDRKTVLFSIDKLGTKELKKTEKITIHQGQAVAETNRLA